MFGLENQKNKKNETFVFELEKELKVPKKHAEIKKNAEAKLLKIKGKLRDGESKEDYEQWGVLVYGYVALLKVMSRFGPK